MKTKHSKGPWISNGGYVQALHETSSCKPFYITIANTNQNLVTPQEAEANACLIASAPELLESLKTMLWILNLDELPKGTGIQNAVSIAQNIVKKAEGEL